MNEIGIGLVIFCVGAVVGSLVTLVYSWGARLEARSEEQKKTEKLREEIKSVESEGFDKLVLDINRDLADPKRKL